MLGYTYDEVATLITRLNEAVYELENGALNPYSVDIDNTIELLNGLLEEGHVS